MASSSTKQDGGQKKEIAALESPPLVYLTNKWIQELSQRIRSRPIPWEGYHRADLLSADELKMIKSVDAIIIGQNRSKLDPLFEEQGKEYVSLYLRLLSKLSRTDTLQQILVLIDDMLVDHDDRLQLFLSFDGKEEQDGLAFPWRPFVKLLDVPDDFVQMKSAHFLTLLLIGSTSNHSMPDPPKPLLARLLSFLSSLLRGASQKMQSPQHQQSSRDASSSATPAFRRASPGFAEGNGPEIALILLEALLRVQTLREQIWQAEVQTMGATKPSQDQKHSDNGSDESSNNADADRGVLPELTQILRLSNIPSGSAFNSSVNSPEGSGSVTPSRSGAASSSASTLVASVMNNANGASRASTQLVYQTILCFWLLTFRSEIAEEINIKTGLIPLLVDVARNAVKEKVIRVTVATLRNLLAKAPEANASAMLGSKCLPLCENLLSRKWSDEEIEDDLQYMKEELAQRLRGMTTYDEYLSELSSGSLTFESPVHELDFWRTNAPKLVEEDAKALKQLVSILQESTDPVTLSVACSDMGNFVHFFEQGKKRVGDLGAKTRIMDLMSHPDANVKYYALHTVAKLVSASWR